MPRHMRLLAMKKSKKRTNRLYLRFMRPYMLALDSLPQGKTTFRIPDALPQCAFVRITIFPNPFQFVYICIVAYMAVNVNVVSRKLYIFFTLI